MVEKWKVKENCWIRKEVKVAVIFQAFKRFQIREISVSDAILNQKFLAAASTYKCMQMISQYSNSAAQLIWKFK